jgi:hypothetical protein
MPIKSRSAKRKGAVFEKQVVAWLRGLGLEARRQPGSGIFADWPHDGQVIIGDRKCILEMKKRAAIPKTFEGWLGGADILVMASDRAQPEDYRVYLRAEFFEWLIKAANFDPHGGAGR